jgi:hypothetical protein
VENCNITQLTVTSKGLSFQYLANSLPYPVDSVSRVPGNPQKQFEALNVVPFTNEFNREMLFVKGLKPGNYALSIDGKEIGKWNASEWEKGINLAVIPTTPQYQQATIVAKLNQQRKEIEDKLRGYYWMQFNLFRDKNLEYADNQECIDLLNQYAAAYGFPYGWKRDDYMNMRLKGVRDSWRAEMNRLTDQIYRVNKPAMHKMEIVRLK